MQLSANPLKMLEQLVGPEILDRIYKNLALIGCIIFAIMMGPFFVMDLIHGFLGLLIPS